jgi:hypothetical protein
MAQRGASVTVSSATKHALRTDLAEAICAAQALPSPRSRLQQMRYSLLCNALLALDPDSRFDDAFAVRIAVHALIEWRGALQFDLSAYALP